MSEKTENELKLSLKIIVDTKAKRVVFAETGKDFVDFIFHLLSLPLATVVKHLKDKAMGGCLGTIRKSFDSLGSKYFEPNIVYHSVFNSDIDVVVPKLSLIDTPARSLAYKCPKHDDAVSLEPDPACTTRGCTNTLYCPVNFVSIRSGNANPGFVKASVPYMVLDDLEVKPMSISLIRHHVKDFDYLDEKVVGFGMKEAVEMLKASLETKAVLTTVFLGKDN